MIIVNEDIRKQILGDEHHLALWVHWLGTDDKMISDFTNMDIVEQSLVLKESISDKKIRLGTADAASCEFDFIIDEHFPFTLSDLTGKRFELYLVCRNFVDGAPVYYDTGIGDIAFCDFNRQDARLKAYETATVQTYLQLKYGSTTVTSPSRYNHYEKDEVIRNNRFFFPRTDENGNTLTQVTQYMVYPSNTTRFNMPVTGLEDCTSIPLGIFKVDECELSTDKRTRHLKAFNDLYSADLDQEISYASGAVVTMSDIINTLSLLTGMDFDLSYKDYSLEFEILRDYEETETYTFGNMPVTGSCTVTLVKSKISIYDFEDQYQHIYEWLSDRSMNNAYNLLRQIEALFGLIYQAGTSPSGDPVTIIGAYTEWINAYHNSSLYNLLLNWKSKFRVPPQPDSSAYFDMWRLKSASFDGMMYDSSLGDGELSYLDLTVVNAAYFQSSAQIPLYNASGVHGILDNRVALIYFPGDSTRAYTFSAFHSAGRSLEVKGQHLTTSGRIYTMRTDGGDSRYGIAAYLKLVDLWEAMRKNMYDNLYRHGLLKSYDGDPDEAEWWATSDYNTYLQFENHMRWYYAYNTLASGSGFVSRYTQWYYNAHNNGQPMDGVFIQIGGDWAMLISTSNHNEGWAYDLLSGLELLSGFYIPHLNSFYSRNKIIELTDEPDPQTGYTYLPLHMELKRIIERQYHDEFANLQFVASSNVTFKVRDLITAYAELHGAFFTVDRYGQLKFLTIVHPIWPETTLYPSENLYPAEIRTQLVYKQDPYHGQVVDYDATNGKIKKRTLYKLDKPLIWKGVRLETVDGWLAPVIEEQRDNAQIYDISNCITRNFVLSNEIKDIIYANVWGAICDISIGSGDYEYVGAPWAECGDTLLISDTEMTIIFNRTLKGVQALTDSFAQRLD